MFALVAALNAALNVLAQSSFGFAQSSLLLDSGTFTLDCTMNALLPPCLPLI